MHNLPASVHLLVLPCLNIIFGMRTALDRSKPAIVCQGHRARSNSENSFGFRLPSVWGLGHV